MKKIFVGQKEKLNFERQHGKNYYVVIKERLLPVRQRPQKVPKIASIAEYFLAGFSLPIATGLSSNHDPKPRKPLFRVVRRFEALLQTGWHPYTSKGTNRGVGEFSGHCYEERFCPLKLQEQRRKHREVGKMTGLPVTLSAPDSARFCLVGLRQNAQGRGSAEGSKKEQDKAVTSPPHTPARSAGRILRFLTSPEHFKSVLQNVP